jgi:hypothetical protein
VVDIIVGRMEEAGWVVMGNEEQEEVERVGGEWIEMVLI